MGARGVVALPLTGLQLLVVVVAVALVVRKAACSGWTPQQVPV